MIDCLGEINEIREKLDDLEKGIEQKIDLIRMQKETLNNILQGPSLVLQEKGIHDIAEEVGRKWDTIERTKLGGVFGFMVVGLFRDTLLERLKGGK
jgi:hypothetical protein